VENQSKPRAYAPSITWQTIGSVSCKAYKKTAVIDLIEATYKDTPNCGVCGEPKRAKNLCTKHYFQLRRSDASL
jgi:hypothetical protein